MYEISDGDKCVFVHVCVPPCVCKEGTDYHLHLTLCSTAKGKPTGPNADVSFADFIPYSCILFYCKGQS